MANEESVYYLKNAQGKAFSMNFEDAKKALQSGWTLELPYETKERHRREEFEDRPFSAFGAGLLRGPTFGISDVLLPATGAVEKRTLKGLEEFNPGAGIFGEVTGIGASLLAPVGKGNLPKLAHKLGVETAEKLTPKILTKGILEGAERTLGQKVAGRVVPSAIALGAESLPYAAGEYISDVALDNVDLSAENAIRYMGLGTLLGAGLGGVLGGAGVLVPEGMAKIRDVGRRLIPENTVGGEFGKELYERTILEPSLKYSTKDPGLVRDFLELSEKGKLNRAIGAMTNQEKEVRYLDFFKNVDEFKNTFTKLKNKGFSEESSVLNDILDQVEVNNAVRGLNDVIGSIDSKIANIKSRPDIFGKKPRFGKVNEYKSLFKDEMNRAAKGEITGSQLYERVRNIRQNFDDYVYNLGKEGSKAERSFSYEMRRSVDEARNYLRDIDIWGEAGKIRSNVDDAFTRLNTAEKELFGKNKKFNLNKVKQVIKKAGTAEGEILSPKLDEYIESYINLIEVFDDSLKLSQGVDSSLLKEIGSKVLKNKEELRNIIEVTKRNRELLYGARGAGETIVEKVAGGLGAGVGAIAGGALGSIAGPFGIAGGAPGGAILGRSLGRGVARLWTNPGKTAELIHFMFEQNRKTETFINKAVERFLSKGKDISTKFIEAEKKIKPAYKGTTLNLLNSLTLDGKKPPKDSEEGLERLKGRINEIKAKPGILAEMTSNAGLEDIPEVQTAIVNRMTTIVNFLSDKIPGNPYEDTQLSFGKRKYKLSNLDERKLNKYLSYVQDPYLVLKDLNEGRVSVEGIETIKTVYPAIYDKIRSRIIEESSLLEDELPYEKRILLSQLFDTPLDPSMNPFNFKYLQETFKIEENAVEESEIPIPKGKPIELSESEESELSRVTGRG